jgi:hypothetical protein
LPAAWEVSSEARQAVGRFLLERAVFLADNIKAISENAFNTETPY